MVLVLHILKGFKYAMDELKADLFLSLMVIFSIHRKHSGNVKSHGRRLRLCHWFSQNPCGSNPKVGVLNGFLL
jgi:hypothetical protein